MAAHEIFLKLRRGPIAENDGKRWCGLYGLSREVPVNYGSVFLNVMNSKRQYRNILVG